jgi:hypothetical protein
MNVITSPEKLILENRYSVFLAGSIEGDTAQKWQDIVIEKLKDTSVTLLNPRRDEWDTSWKQDINNRTFNEQVIWELEALEKANLVIMYFDKSTKSPISLLELGLFAQSGKLVVCCPEGFWRKGNVDIVCERYGALQVQNLEDLIKEVKKKLR